MILSHTVEYCLLIHFWTAEIVVLLAVRSIRKVFLQQIVSGHLPCTIL